MSFEKKNMIEKLSPQGRGITVPLSLSNIVDGAAEVIKLSCNYIKAISATRKNSSRNLLLIFATFRTL